MPDTCYFDFIYEPITPFRKLIFENLISRVSGQKVLDLGCGQVGHYWALGYSDRVKTIDFLDYHQTNIDILSEKIASINPEKLERKFADTINFLKDSKIISLQNYQEIAFNLVSKVRQTEVFDFLKDILAEKYDTILAIESLECVNSKEDFILALNNTAKLLEPKGRLLALVLRYNLPDNYTHKLISEKMEGGLNPDQKQLEKMFKNSDLSLNWIKTVAVPELHNYPEAIFLEAKLK
jgi:2-polyprenyl-3-methyl-5-hydroxy-6-metoxy-1,4-benzoquinol methylase